MKTDPDSKPNFTPILTPTMEPSLNPQEPGKITSLPSITHTDTHRYALRVCLCVEVDKTFLSGLFLCNNSTKIKTDFWSNGVCFQDFNEETNNILGDFGHICFLLQEKHSFKIAINAFRI